MTGQDFEASWAGEPVRLLPQRAVFWPGRRWLFIADLHLGKASVFRQAGLPVPAGTTHANLARLDEMITIWSPAGIVMLGDLLHARAGVTARLRERLVQWRMRHRNVDMWLVRGNHDAHAGDPPLDWLIEVVEQPWRVGPFAFCHEPQQVDGHYAVCGHVHPVFHLAGPGRDRLRLPCFVEREHYAMLPSFGEFTGGEAIQRAPGQRVYVVGGERVWPLAQPVSGIQRSGT